MSFSNASINWNLRYKLPSFGSTTSKKKPVRLYEDWTCTRRVRFEYAHFFSPSSWCPWSGPLIFTSMQVDLICFVVANNSSILGAAAYERGQVHFWIDLCRELWDACFTWMSAAEPSTTLCSLVSKSHNDVALACPCSLWSSLLFVLVPYHSPNTDSEVQKNQWIKPDRPDVV